MLVLTRREGESIRIGKDIVVHLNEISHFNGWPRARIGIEAPDDVLILRSELEERNGTARTEQSDDSCS
jgi:carbon storage regulator CsrA